MTRRRTRRGIGLLVAPVVAGFGLVPMAAVSAAAVPGAGSTVFLNELHYDNAGTDTGEFVEVAGPAGTDLTGWQVVLYNGSNGAVYDTKTLSGTLADEAGGHGFHALTYPSNGIQNGPDGIALVDAAGDLVQFLSYEAALTTDGGPADGRTSTDIGASQGGSEPVGSSLRLTGSGSSYGDFTWAATGVATPGAVNADQAFPQRGALRLTCTSALDVPEGTAATADVSATDADSGIASVAITSGAVDGITLEGSTAPTDEGETATATLTVAGTAAAGTYPVEITATSADGEATCTVTVTVAEPLQTIPISEVQGSGLTSPLDGEEVRVEAVVTSLITYEDLLTGFFLEEERRDRDRDAETSEGVYVSCGSSCPSDLAAGDLVRVTGTADEFYANTQIDVTGGTLEVLESGLELPPAATVTLPADASTRHEATFEHVEGVRTTIATTLVVSEYFQLARYGEIVLTAGERELQFTQTNLPSEEGYQAFLADLATRRIVLDDASNDQNDATSGPGDDEPYPYPSPSYPEGGLSTDSYVRGGDTVAGLTGVLEYAFGAWKLRPVPGEDYTFQPANPRPDEPEDVGGRLQVASFNVLNYFATIDTTASTSTGDCGPSGTLDCRGADSEAERQRQLAKIVAALEEIDADVYGLIEIENDEGEATQQIVDALNEATDAGTYDSVDTGYIGTDAIKQAFVYDTETLAPVGEHELLTQADDPRFVDSKNRPALVQSFEEVATGQVFTVAVNHLKSKGSDCDELDDPDVGDGQGNCNVTRTQAAEALADYLAKDPTGSGDPDALIIGDLNAYSSEDPIRALEEEGYVDLLERHQGLESYGYVFDGLLGHLDHALATDPLAGQVTGAGGWRINADEVPLLDYDDRVLDTGERSFERESGALPLYEPDPYRSSDHDPVIVGLSLGDGNAAPVADAGGPYTVRPGRTVTLDASGSADADGDDLTVAWDLDGDGQHDDATGATARLRGNGPPGRYEVAVEVSDGQDTDVDETVVRLVPRGHDRRPPRP